MLVIGADAFAVSDPEGAAPICAAGVKAPILLYASACPKNASNMPVCLMSRPSRHRCNW